ncbi:glycosyltransferase [Psychromonas sp. MME2]|uniref:glycosyltransferase n=1 Tax=Psychromonas sp. MME2 TaxID=3231033 RepID=UPI00339C86AF
MKKISIDLLAPPFKGHLHPILSMGKQLLAHGFDVTVLSSETAKVDIEAAGLRPLLLTSIDDKILIECVNPAYAVRSSPTKLIAQFKQVISFFRLLKTELETIYAERSCDLMIADFTLPVAGIVADQNDIVWWTSMPSPCVIESSTGTPSYLGGWKESDSLPLKARDWLGRKLVRLFKRSAFYLCKKTIRSLGLDNIYREDGTEVIYSKHCILCLGYQDFEFSKNWPKAAKFVGPMLYTPEITDEPAHEAPMFQENKRYVLVTLGTHLDWCKKGIYQEVEKLSIQFPDVVFHFTDGNANNDSYAKSHNQCFRFSYINYECYLPKYDFVIHHGGAGILYYCLQFEKPCIVIPQDYDQFDHAARLEALNLSIWVKNVKEISIALQTLLMGSCVAQSIKSFNERYANKNHNLALLGLVESEIKRRDIENSGEQLYPVNTFF